MKNLYLISLIALIFSCKKENDPIVTLPVLTTSLVINIGGSSAGCGGNITSDGDSPITKRGVCWGLNNNPTTDDAFTIDGNGSGIFTSEITDLIQRTNYYARAYATNSAGTAYGNSVLFTTTNVFITGNYYFSAQNFEYYANMMNGDTINYKVSELDSTIFDCNYECKGKLSSDPQNGLIVEGIWYKFFRVSGQYQSTYFVVQQKDNQNLIIRTSNISYEAAYKLGNSNNYYKL